MVKISPFSPIFFPSLRSDGLPSRYVQTFAVGDPIVIEAFADTDPTAYLVNLSTNSLTRIAFAKTALSGYSAYLATLTPGEGSYYVAFNGIGNSQPFAVTSDQSELDGTSLIAYSNADNTRRKDAMFLLGGNRVCFYFRVPGGFKPSAMTFSIDNEQFETSDCDIVELYSQESAQEKFTLGTSLGAPIWYGEMLNRLLCCQYVYFDGLRYARKGSSVPEINPLAEGEDTFVFGITLQRINNDYPTLQSYLNG